MIHRHKNMCFETRILPQSTQYMLELTTTVEHFPLQYLNEHADREI